jgi:hypothetical protein
MKKNIVAVLVSVSAAVFLMSGGYGSWKKSIKFSGSVYVIPPPVQAPIPIVAPESAASNPALVPAQPVQNMPAADSTSSDSAAVVSTPESSPASTIEASSTPESSAQSTGNDNSDSQSTSVSSREAPPAPSEASTQDNPSVSDSPSQSETSSATGTSGVSDSKGSAGVTDTSSADGGGNSVSDGAQSNGTGSE